MLPVLLLFLVVMLAVCGCDSEPVNESSVESVASPHPSDRCAQFEILVGFGVGGGTDSFARHLAVPLAEQLGSPVKVRNFVGGSGINAYRELLGRQSNGCSLLAITSDYTVLAAVPDSEGDLGRLALLVRAHSETGLFLGASDASWSELVTELGPASRPLLVGGIGARSFDRAVVVSSLRNQPFRFRYIPYRGAREMQADLLAGRLDAIYDEFSVVRSLLTVGELGVLLQLTSGPTDVPADAPTSADLGLAVPPKIWRGMAVSAATPLPIQDDLVASLREALAAESYRRYEVQRALDEPGGKELDPDAFSRSVQREVELFETVFR